MLKFDNKIWIVYDNLDQNLRYFLENEILEKKSVRYIQHMTPKFGKVLHFGVTLSIFWESVLFLDLFGSSKFKEHFIFGLFYSITNYFDIVCSIFQYILHYFLIIFHISKYFINM